MKTRSSTKREEAESPASSTSSSSPQSQSTSPSSYIPQRGLDALKNYKFCAVTDSPVENYIFDPFWNHIVHYFPRWLAPNSITVGGLLCCLLAYSLVTSYSHFQPREHSWDPAGQWVAFSAPSWVYYTTAVLFFCYITFDGVDGKQARRTGSASPLGEVVDHGVDGMVCTIMALTMCVCCSVGMNRLEPVSYEASSPLISLGESIMSNLNGSSSSSSSGGFVISPLLVDDLDLLATYIICMILFVSFYLVTWESYHTGMLYFGVISVIEGELAVCLLLILSGVYGTAVWVSPLGDVLTQMGVQYGSTGVLATLAGVQVKHILFSIELIMGVFNVLQSIRNMVPLWRSGKVSLTILARTCISVVFLLSLSFVWIWTSPQNVLLRYNHQLLWTFGLIQEDALLRLLIAKICKLRDFIPTFTAGHACLLLAIINANYGRVVLGYPYAFVDEGFLLSVMNLFMLVRTIFFISGCIDEICQYLKISAFSVASVGLKGKKKN
eukprot:Nk52_evm10s1524 gene=Nk52_evmTU10s1524